MTEPYAEPYAEDSYEGRYDGLNGELRLLWRSVWRGPPPYPVLYVCCGACGKIGPRRIVRHAGAHSSDGWLAMPGEYECPLCREWAPRVQSDWINADDPATDATALRCRHRLDALLWWRRCGTRFRAPAGAELIQCPACGTWAPPDQW